MLFIYPPIWLLAFIHQSETNVDIWTPYYGASDNISPYSHLLLNWVGSEGTIWVHYPSNGHGSVNGDGTDCKSYALDSQCWIRSDLHETYY